MNCLNHDFDLINLIYRISKPAISVCEENKSNKVKIVVANLRYKIVMIDVLTISGVIFEHRAQPFLYFFQWHIFSFRIILNLIFLNLANAKIFALGMCKIPSTNG